MFIFCTTSLVIRVYSTEVTAVNAMVLVSGAANTLTLTYYHISFIFARNVNRRILYNLGYVDKCLGSIGVKITHVKHHVICYVSFILIITIRMLITILHMYTELFQQRENNFVSQVKSSLSICVQPFEIFVYFHIP